MCAKYFPSYHDTTVHMDSGEFSLLIHEFAKLHFIYQMQTLFVMSLEKEKNTATLMVVMMTNTQCKEE
jgi:hypothetical protein